MCDRKGTHLKAMDPSNDVFERFVDETMRFHRRQSLEGGRLNCDCIERAAPACLSLLASLLKLQDLGPRLNPSSHIQEHAPRRRSGCEAVRRGNTHR